MTTTRLDIYKEVHKGIRKALFDLTAMAGSTEFQSAQSLKKLQDQFELVFSLLETHGHVEDNFIEPLIKDYDASAAQHLAAVHETLDSALKALQSLVRKLDSGQENVTVQGQSFYLELTKFVADYLHHIADEEQTIMPLLWGRYDDQKLLEVSATIRANIPPPLTANFMSYMIPAINHSERVTMLSGMKNGAPPEVFDRVCLLARKVLSDDAWADLQRSIV